MLAAKITETVCDKMLNITIYNEFKHERESESVAAIYPNGIHGLLAEFIGNNIECNIKTFTVDDVNEGLTDEVLDNTDVLLWWGHMAHDLVDDEVAVRVRNHVHEGMGAIFLHSGHHSKPFKLLMGTTCNLLWGEGVKEVVWTTDLTHPIAKGIPDHFILEKEELYGEVFDIPTPDATVFTSWFESGHVFRSGCAYARGRGRIFYFQPGHEEYPTFKNEIVQKVIMNAIEWTTPSESRGPIDCPMVKPVV